jgi:hypothetical protein
MVPSMDKLRQFDKYSKAKAKEAYDRRHGARTLQDLQPGDLVLMKTEKGKNVVNRVLSLQVILIIVHTWLTLRTVH